ncbi:hypothetical protein GJA_3848 [Janthinobacterium agaricidamnosum NBRC 102515 = DSM 9628]|uniref:Uncharacterized protein n=1 Tax=Janthinobacterium agaricidamnosum NBRC 102515 = DSM 9628 TaxID=1349767 RepID=W0VA62_9BURK|nr:hypothetical protein GJA_3848 [Janthinobacterium agaricidamnosum NBRC 102515 = DSM 9628]
MGETASRRFSCADYIGKDFTSKRIFSRLFMIPRRRNCAAP